MNRCLICYGHLAEGGADVHASCSRRLYGDPVPPLLPYSEADLEPLATEIIRRQTSLTGVQAKLSLHVSGRGKEGAQRRFTIVGLWGGYILKPPTPHYPQLPEVEDLTMHLAGIAGIRTASHGLVRLASGNLAYLTRRMDRSAKEKRAMEDMCQLTERLTEDKYNGSYEQIGRAIMRYSATPGLDLVDFFEIVLFSFLTGNADMHLKNFALLDRPGLGMTLAPAYDLVNTALINPADEEELALTLNGKKRRIQSVDFESAMSLLKVDARQRQNIFDRMAHAIPAWHTRIRSSFLSEANQERYAALVSDRAKRIGLV
jgi:serine/threonine-protein kinase HipA